MKELAIGLAAGVMSGLLGVGGGLIMVPTMMFGMKMSQRAASATSLAAVVPIAAIGAIVLSSAFAADVPTAIVVGVAAAVGAPLGTRILALRSDRELRLAFACLLFVTAATLALKA